MRVPDRLAARSCARSGAPTASRPRATSRAAFDRFAVGAAARPPRPRAGAVRARTAHPRSADPRHRQAAEPADTLAAQVGIRAMMFSTKAEYGVRVMVELARRPRASEPGSAGRDRRRTTACRWPTSSTSWRACARPAWSTRGAARAAATCSRAPPSRSRWPRWSRRWRARSRRSSASPRRPTDRSCARASPSLDHVCPTKLLWTRVRSSIVRTLQETTLADLLAPAVAPVRRTDRRCRPPAPANRTPDTTGA